MRRRTCTVVFVLLVLVACASHDPGVSVAAATRLHAQVAALRSAAARGDRTAASRQLAQFRTELDRLRARGEINADAEARIRRAIAVVQAQLSLLPAPTTTTTTVVANDEKGHGKSKHEGNGN